MMHVKPADAGIFSCSHITIHAIANEWSENRAEEGCEDWKKKERLKRNFEIYMELMRKCK